MVCFHCMEIYDQCCTQTVCHEPVGWMCCSILVLCFLTCWMWPCRLSCFSCGSIYLFLCFWRWIFLFFSWVHAKIFKVGLNLCVDFPFSRNLYPYLSNSAQMALLNMSSNSGKPANRPRLDRPVTTRLRMIFHVCLMSWSVGHNLIIAYDWFCKVTL